MFYLLLSAAVFGLSVLMVKIFQWVAWRWKILDYPSSARKIHTEPVPLTGGLAIAISFLSAIAFLYLFDYFKFIDFSGANLLAIAGAVLVLMIGGTLDDKYNLSAKWQLLTPLLAILVVVWSGVSVDFLTNPLNGSLIYLSDFVGKILVFAWLLGLMYTTKLLDGLDGLVGGMTFIGSGIIALLIFSMDWLQADVILLVLAFMAALAGFLIFNLPKASVFLGEGGSLLAGFMLGVFSILAGSKIATTLLVMALPIIDTAWVIAYRLYLKKPIFSADKNHLHHRLLALGWRPYQILAFIYGVSFLFGLSTLLLNPLFKLIILLCLIGGLLLFEYYLTIKILKQEKL